MTVSSAADYVIHQGNGVATTFPYTFRIPENSFVRVYIQDVATGEILEEVASGDYSITGISWSNYSGGELTYPLTGSPLDGTKNIVLRRIVPYAQGLDLQNQGGFYPETVENQLDLLAMQIQQIATDAGQSIQAALGFDPNDPASPSVDQTLVHSDQIDYIVKLTQAEYDALGTPSSTTLYVIVG